MSISTRYSGVYLMARAIVGLTMLLLIAICVVISYAFNTMVAGGDTIQSIMIGVVLGVVLLLTLLSERVGQLTSRVHNSLCDILHW